MVTGEFKSRVVRSGSLPECPILSESVWRFKVSSIQQVPATGARETARPMVAACHRHASSISGDHGPAGIRLSEAAGVVRGTDASARDRCDPS